MSNSPSPAPRKRIPRWQAPFLRALSKYGNVRLAAEAAGIDKTAAYTRRRKDPGFAAAWDRAKARAAARLAAAGMKPVRGLPPGIEPGDWSRARGDDGLVVHGGHGFTPPRMQRPRRWGWSADRERVFLQTLADTCNVSAAARAISMTLPPLYQRRKQGHHFAKAWDAALGNGLAALEARLIQACCDLMEGNAPPPCFTPGGCTGARAGCQHQRCDLAGQRTQEAARGDQAAGVAAGAAAQHRGSAGGDIAQAGGVAEIAGGGGLATARVVGRR